MKFHPPMAVLTAAGAILFSAPLLRATENQGIALAIIYDTSGSMSDRVPDRAGGTAPKYVIANRALRSLARQVQAFATNAPTADRAIQTGLFIFQGDQAKAAVKFGPFDASALERWADGFSTPRGNTPLGNALTAAGRAVLASGLPRKHILVITDGINTAGPPPATALSRLREECKRRQDSLSVHFIAFDVDAKVFTPLKKLDATVVAAADEAQLNSQLQFILQRKILLEDEEPTKTH